MQSFSEWIKETNVNHEKLGGVHGIYGNDIHDAEMPLVHLLYPIIMKSLKSRPKVEMFDELVEALPVAFSMAIPEIKALPAIYGQAALRELRNKLEELDAIEGPVRPDEDEWNNR